MSEVAGTCIFAILVKKVDMALVTRTSPWLLLHKENLSVQAVSINLPSYLLWVLHMSRVEGRSK